MAQSDTYGRCTCVEVGGDIKWVLKSSIFVVQKANAPKIGVEFCQRSIGAISSSVASPYDVWRRRAALPDKSV